MKLPKLLRRKKLRATAGRPSLRASAQADYEEMSEPNMKLSRALLIVLVLHVVAVSGIIAFNAIKTRQGSIAPAPASTKNTALASKAFGVGSTMPLPVHGCPLSKRIPCQPSRLRKMEVSQNKV